MKYPRIAQISTLGRPQLTATCKAEATPSGEAKPEGPAQSIGFVTGAACARPPKFLIDAIVRREAFMAQEFQRQYDHSSFDRFFGGPPLAVIGRLILLSILVGVILAAIGLDPWNILQSVQRLIEHIWNMGFDAVRWLWRYFLLGAVIVVPLWLLVRLARVPRGR
jgi:hypothetical protein